VSEPGNYEVVVPAYRVERTIADTLDSLVAQSLPPARILVADDETPDGSIEVAQRYDVEVLRFPHSGLSGVQNRALEHVGAPLVAYVDADDVWHPDAGRELVEVLTATGAGAASLSAEPFEDGHQLVFGDRRPVVWTALDRDVLVRGNTLLKSGTMYHTAALREVSGWRVELPICGDHDMGLRLLEVGHAVYRTDWRGVGQRLSPTSMIRDPGPTLAEQLQVAVPRLDDANGDSGSYARKLWLQTLARAARDRRDLRQVPKLGDLMEAPPFGQAGLDTLVHSPLRHPLAAGWRAWRER
jgi:glycosyltransferase involved in cell wall biosynthesis